MASHLRGAGLLKTLLILLAVPVLILLLAIGFYEGRKAYWDSKVREMCAKDGGVSIVEKISISMEERNNLPQVNGIVAVTTKSLSDPRSPAFLTISETTIKSGDPSVLRYEQVVMRRTDNSAIAKAIFYVRSGGDIPSHAFPSSYYCPSLKEIGLDISKVFKIEESKK
jgi:hypothetical protein